MIFALKNGSCKLGAKKPLIFHPRHFVFRNPTEQYISDAAMPIGPVRCYFGERINALHIPSARDPAALNLILKFLWSTGGSPRRLFPLGPQRPRCQRSGEKYEKAGKETERAEHPSLAPPTNCP